MELLWIPFAARYGGFRVNAKLRRACRRRKRRLLQRIDKKQGASRTPMIRPPRSNYELAEKPQAVACGGLGMIMDLVRETGLRDEINRAARVLKVYAPYDEADHVLNIALNLLTGGTCLEHLEERRNDEAYLDALGAPRIPDPTTAGDFCRRFDEFKTLLLLQGINRARRVVWKQQPQEFFQQAAIDADGTLVEIRGEKKEGIGMNYQGQGGYHPLVVSLGRKGSDLFVCKKSRFYRSDPFTCPFYLPEHFGSSDGNAVRPSCLKSACVSSSASIQSLPMPSEPVKEIA
jgi:hypothetical protein